MSKNNLALVEHCKKALKEGWKYTWSSYGYILNSAILKDLQKRYPAEINRYYDYIVFNNMNKRNADCSGLIKSYLFEWENNSPVYDSKYDLSDSMVLDRAKEKGTIDTTPEIPGLCVHYKGHIGVYIGNGEVIESRGTLYGVVKTKLKERPWTHWSKHPHIEYVENTNLKIGSKGQQVIDLQNNLNKLGYNLIVDGDFGNSTENTVKDFQSKNNLVADGIVGDKTKEAIETAFKVNIPFKDWHDISDYAKASVEKMKKLSIMVGDSNGNFNPKQSITREDLAVVIDKLLSER